VRIAVDLFEPHPSPGAGPVYDPAQPEFLRMNFAASQLDMWWPSSRAVPPDGRLSFVEWSGDDGDSYPPRAEVGRYLSEGFATLRRHAPPNVAIRLCPEAVEAASPDEHGGWVLRAGGRERSYDELLISVGHGRSAFPFEPRVLAGVTAGATVAVRGFALTFIDLALALTEGRGGTFESLDHPYRLRYLPGPDEPRLIVPFTRTGRPMLAKPAASVAARLPGLGRVAAEGGARIADIGGVADLHGDLLPILAATACSSLSIARGDVTVALPITVGRWLGEAAGGVAGAGEIDARRAIEQSLRVGAGLAIPDVAWALGHTWRTLYPAVVARLGGDGLSTRDWPAFLRLARELERVAFGPSALNAAKLLALIDAGRIDLGHLRDVAPAADSVIDAVLPGPGLEGDDSLLGDLVRGGHARVAAGRRGLEVTPNGSCRGRDGSITPGLAAIGRPTEDSVIGNDTLSRSLHPQADRWARQVARRGRENFLAAALGAQREAAPA
jgi:uncharacterized NAD(P)/FAD-binding protein YdhS